jgi:hypothetical protein
VEEELQIEAALPPRRVHLRLMIAPSESGDGLGVSWEAGEKRGLVAGPPAEVARAVGALVLRLADYPEDDEPDDTRPVRVSA